jgi:transcriptional regulator with XRE-family HTH domain
LPAASFGELLRRRRIEASLTQEKLAELCRLSPKTVAALEQGRQRGPRLSTVKEIADALGLNQAARTELAIAAPAGGAPVRPPFRTGGGNAPEPGPNLGAAWADSGERQSGEPPGLWSPALGFLSAKSGLVHVPAPVTPLIGRRAAGRRVLKSLSPTLAASSHSSWEESSPAGVTRSLAWRAEFT